MLPDQRGLFRVVESDFFKTDSAPAPTPATSKYSTPTPAPTPTPATFEVIQKPADTLYQKHT